MNWNRVQLIFLRELRDQLRDRRTMFTICILPLLLYPLTGLMMLQLAQVQSPAQTMIAVVGDSKWLEESGARNEVRASRDDRKPGAISWTYHPADSPLAIAIDRKLPRIPRLSGNRLDQAANETIQELLLNAHCDAILVMLGQDAPPESRDAPTGSLANPTRDDKNGERLMVLSNQRVERSRMAVLQVDSAIERWQHQFIRTQLKKHSVPDELWTAPSIEHLDTASAEIKQAVLWSKILPFVMLIWALTGAFYPAVDLCAGEKERGTLETLLSSPATRREIVWGKLLTVMSFSFITAVLNLISMSVTTSFVLRHVLSSLSSGAFNGLSPISIDLMLWLVVLVIPMSAMFSALALAVASLARSTKEGQYYLMPLMLVGFPLVMLPILPGITLSSGTSIVPVTGAVLLSRALMDGEYGTALIYLPSVACVTVLCCLLAIRWAVRQFENESVLFSDVEKGSMKGWLIHFWHHRPIYPSATESVLCGLSILVALFFGRLAMGSKTLNWPSFATSTILIQIGLMLGPTMIMAVMLTRSVRKSLRLELPRISEFIACALLAVFLHPTYVNFSAFVSRAYPLGPETIDAMRQIDSVLGSVPLWHLLLVLAVIPALCEEIVFRGFIFAGLLENKGVLRAVIGSAVLFGLSHGVLQQTVCATGVGIIMGWLAYRTGGIACTCVFHVIHNSISMTLSTWHQHSLQLPHCLNWAMVQSENGMAYTDSWNAISLMLACLLLLAFMYRGGSQAAHAGAKWIHAAG